MAKEVEIRMAKASPQDIERVRRFLQLMERIDECGDSYKPQTVLNRIFGWWHRLKVDRSWNRVIWGCDTLIANCCDPDLDYLEFKPEIKQMPGIIQSLQAEVKRLNAVLASLQPPAHPMSTEQVTNDH